MSNPMEVFTGQALKQFGSVASQEFHRRLLEDRQLCATRCKDCGEAAFPPRMHCPSCLGDAIDWVEITADAGATLYAFTTQSRGLRFTAPEVIGVVDVPNVGMFISPIAGTMHDLEIGQALAPEIVDIHEGLSFYRFVPA
jgi:uncharacterized OB-fold protein